MAKRTKGERIGPFRVREAISAGVQADSYICVDSQDNLVFVKEYQKPENEVVRNWLHKEAEALSGLRSEYLPRYITSDVTSDKPWIALEFVPGWSLAEHLEDSGPISDADATKLAYKLALALQALDKRKYVHRDVKPANIMLTSASCKLVDLGLVGGEAFQTMTILGQPGTYYFASPEQSHGGAKLTPASDIYSLAVTLLFAIGLYRGPNDPLRPFKNRPLAQLLESIVTRDDPAERPDAETFAELLLDLDLPASTQTRLVESNQPGGNSQIEEIKPVAVDRSEAGVSTILGWCITAGHCSECPGVVRSVDRPTYLCNHHCHVQ